MIFVMAVVGLLAPTPTLKVTARVSTSVDHVAQIVREFRELACLQNVTEPVVELRRVRDEDTEAALSASLVIATTLGGA